jgi:hypothetical protein
MPLKIYEGKWQTRVRRSGYAGRSSGHRLRVAQIQRESTYPPQAAIPLPLEAT